MNHHESTRSLAALAALVFAISTIGCAKSEHFVIHLPEVDSATEESAPLGGDALTQRKREMERAYRDMIHFQVTMDSLRDQRDRNGSILFDRFLDHYMGTHLDPMLRPEWQSRHPELMSLDASLRFVEADLLARMHDTRRVEQTIEELLRRFKGRENTIVQYPIGSQGTIAEGISVLRDKKWRG